MDNQKSDDGNARNVGSEGTGSSMGKASDATQPMAERFASSAHAGVDKVSGAMTEVSTKMDEKTHQLADAYKHFAETGRDYVRTSPATSLLVALGAGFVLSKLLSRRH
ncbi:MAG: DUF883 C-terminal domain-containing protein [Pseudomonadota bacterium]